ncbi:MAG: tRNA pseudouridine(13) synthase TruD [Planctomycetes bacterium]|nr:tRNA pseudouridine(13) synthase TruD [Planctomycetota bacterium]
MKLKQQTQDFVVEEISSFAPDPAGRFFVYELEKQSLSTFEALALIARKAGLRPSDLSASGLKDKHGATRQLFSSPRALSAPVDDDRLRLRFVGKSTAPLTASSIEGNRFRIVLRDLSQQEADAIPANAQSIRDFGIPNYYDNQRFGGNAHGQGFIAKALAQGCYEEAMRLHLAVPHRKQSMRDKTNRRLAKELWGKWAELHERMTRSPERALVEFLRDHPGQFAAAFDRITPQLRTMFVAAYQSLLFNLVLARLIRSEIPALADIHNRGGDIPMYFSLTSVQLARWRDLEVPLPGGSTRLEDFPEAGPHLQAVLTEEGITLEQLRLPGLDRTRFKAASRRALMFPADLAVGAVQPDDLNEGSSKVETTFTLPRGSFATIVARRLVIRS